jgi:hypothetical protein
LIDPPVSEDRWQRPPPDALPPKSNRRATSLRPFGDETYRYGNPVVTDSSITQQRSIDGLQTTDQSTVVLAIGQPSRRQTSSSNSC